MLRRRIRSLPCLSMGYFLCFSCVLFMAGMVFGFLSSDGFFDSDAPMQVFETQRVCTQRFLYLLSRHLLWLVPSVIFSLLAFGAPLVCVLLFLRGALIAGTYVMAFELASAPVLLLRTLIVSVLCCAPLIVFCGFSLFRSYRMLLRMDAGAWFAAPVSVVLLGAVLLLLSVLCSFAELWLLPGFASYIQPFT